jgi:hypothetical protein
LIIIIMLGKEYKSRSSSLCRFLHSPVTSSLYGQNILLNILFPNTLSLCSSLNARNQVSHPYRTACGSKADEKTEDSAQNGSIHYQNSTSS